MTTAQIDFNKLDQVIRRHIPSGMNIRKKSHVNANKIPLDEIISPINEGRARVSIGILGGGNHFIELNEGTDGSIYLVIHSGSRNPGKQISDYYQALAVDSLFNQGEKSSITRDKAYIGGQNMQNYLHDVNIAQKYAALNPKTISEIIIEKMGWQVISEFDTIHNYVDIDNMILRKGAISALTGEIVIIPMNMRDGSLICSGKGNPEWNYSGPHGAGRVMSRYQAKREVKLTEFEDTMKDV